MIYRVLYTGMFLARVQEHVAHLLRENVDIQTIAAWYDRLFDVLDSLDDMPKRFAFDETLTKRSGTLTRKVNHGDHLVFYEVDDATATVHVIEFMHGATDWKR